MKDSDILEIILDNLKTCDKYIIIRDENGNIIYPMDIDRIRDIEQLTKNKSNGNEFFDLCSGNYYTRKSSIGSLDGKTYTFELIENNNRLKKIEEKSKYDVLTKLLNKDSIMTIIDTALLNRNRDLNSLAIAICDIDEFKQINDTYTHLAGDHILEEVASTFKKYESDKCFIGRFGGDEFVFIFKNVDVDVVYGTIEKIKQEVQNIVVQFNDSEIKNVTMSFGIYAMENYSPMEFSNLNQIIEKRRNIFFTADEALYESKQNGKNKITLVTNDDTKKNLE